MHLLEKTEAMHYLLFLKANIGITSSIEKSISVDHWFIHCDCQKLYKYMETIYGPFSDSL